MAPAAIGAARYDLVTKKRSDDSGKKPAPAKRTTTKRSKTERPDAPEPRRAVEAAVSAGSKKAARPKLRASHAGTSEGGVARRTTIGRSKGLGPAGRGPAVRK